jgi:sugar lactone lactonase YvrE
VILAVSKVNEPTRRTSPWRCAAAIISLFVATGGMAHADEPPAAEFLLEWGERGDKPGQFYSPIGLAINQRDEVIVTDLNNARLQRFSDAGEYRGGFDLPHDPGDRKTSQAGGVAVDSEGLIYVTFMSQDKIRVFNDAGELVREWGQRGAGDGDLAGPGGIFLSGDGTLLVADQRNHRVLKLTTAGTFLAKWGEHGAQPGQFGGAEPAGSRFAGPHFVARDSTGRIYTTEGALARIQQFSPAGKPLLAWGNKTSEPGGFGDLKFGSMTTSLGPIAVAVDRFDRVYVSSLNDRVQVFSTEGKFLFGIGGTGDDPGQFAKPHGMAFDSHDNLYVADAGNQRIQKFKIAAPTAR